MNREHRRMLAACRFRTVFLPVAGAAILRLQQPDNKTKAPAKALKKR